MIRLKDLICRSNKLFILFTHLNNFLCRTNKLFILFKLVQTTYYVVRTSYLSCLNELYLLFKQDK